MRWYEIYESISTEEKMRQTLLDLLTPLYRQKVSKVPVNYILDQMKQDNDFSGFIDDYDMLSDLIDNDPKQRFKTILNIDSIQKNDKGKLEIVFLPPNDHSKEGSQPEMEPNPPDMEAQPDQPSDQDQSGAPQDQGGMEEPGPPDMNAPQGQDQTQNPNSAINAFNNMASAGQNTEKQNDQKVNNMASSQLNKGK